MSFRNIPDGSGATTWKDPVATTGDLPATGNSVGDARVVETPSPSIYVWDGATWVAAAGGSGDINNGGNSFSAPITIGTNDDFPLNLETNGATRITIKTGDSSDTGASAILAPNTGDAIGTDLLLKSGSPSTGDNDAGGVYVVSGNASGTGQGGWFLVNAGNAPTSGDGGFIEIDAGNSDSGNGGPVHLTAGNSNSLSGGSVFISSGFGTPNGSVQIYSGPNQMAVFHSDGTHIDMPNQVSLRAYDADASNYVGIGAPTAVSSDYTILLPADPPANNTFLEYNGSDYVWTAGTGNDSFSTMATDSGTNPVASSPTDTLTFTSKLVDVQGNSSTDTIAFLSIAEVANGNSGSAFTIDWDNGPAQAIVLNDDVNLTLNNPQSGTAYVLKITQDGGGSHTVTWPMSVKWPASTAPVITITGSKTDLINLYYDGTDYLGSFSQNYTL